MVGQGITQRSENWTQHCQHCVEWNRIPSFLAARFLHPCSQSASSYGENSVTNTYKIETAQIFLQIFEVIIPKMTSFFWSKAAVWASKFAPEAPCRVCPFSSGHRPRLVGHRPERSGSVLHWRPAGCAERWLRALKLGQPRRSSSIKDAECIPWAKLSQLRHLRKPCLVQLKGIAGHLSLASHVEKVKTTKGMHPTKTGTRRRF